VRGSCVFVGTIGSDKVRLLFFVLHFKHDSNMATDIPTVANFSSDTNALVATVR